MAHADASGNDEGQRPCARLEWCSARTVRIENGERVVAPAFTYRPYCDACQVHIGECLADMPALYGRLAAAIGDPQQADVWVPVPFGPQVPLREDIDAIMRAMAGHMAGWHERVASVARLSAPDTERSRLADGSVILAEAVRILAAHLSSLLSLEPGEMIRWLPSHAVPEGAEVLARDKWQAKAIVMLGGEEAGHEVQHLHYLARRALLETNPPPELLITPCRNCTWRSLRRAWPEGDRDLYSRCQHCGDELTTEEYDVNARRWVAYFKAHQERPVLADTPAA
jgi:hypothetical protein